MKTYTENISTLIANKIKGTITEREEVELNLWVNAKASNKALYDKLISQAWFEEKVSAYSKIDTEKSIKEMKSRIEKRSHRIQLTRYSVAASVLAAILCSAFFLTQKQNTSIVPTDNQVALQQKTCKAILTLGDGTTVKIGDDSIENNTNYAVIDAEQIRYNESKDVKPTINKLFIPRTENYSIVLSDNTRVWLNSETELIYPTVFSGDKREVYLKGEAYFEVTKSQKPFVVKTSNSSIKVLGTSFNVSCYSNEPELTTLTEGRVELKNSQSNKLVILNPGMQGVITNNNSDITVNNVNTYVYSAWRDGLINFENESLENIMKYIERWYDVKVVYDDEDLKDLHFYLKISKSESISEFIRILETTKVIECDINNNIIKIMRM